jgi:WD40 repeat protein
MKSFHINAMTVDKARRFCFSGDKNGALHILRCSTFELVCHEQVLKGTIQAVAYHDHLQCIGILGKDKFIYIYRFDSEHMRLILEKSYDLRSYCGRQYADLHSESQAIMFHPERPVVATRSANGGLVVLDYSTDEVLIESHFFEGDTVTTQFSRDGRTLLAGSTRGDMAVFIDFAFRFRLRTQEVVETIHWFEETEPGVFLVANDARRLMRLDLKSPLLAESGPVFALDDMEHVCYLDATERVFASSFDYHVYEMDKNDLSVKRVVARLPFKLRWMRPCSEQNDELIVQCRNGLLYRVFIESGRFEVIYGNVGPTLWTCAFRNQNDAIMAGDFSHILRLGIEPNLGETQLSFSSSSPVLEPHSFAKRVVYDPFVDQYLIGTSAGKIYSDKQGEIRLLAQLEGPVRDLCSSPSHPVVFAAIGTGQVIILESLGGRILNKLSFEQPVWALAYNEKHRILAIAERLNFIHLLSFDTMTVLAKVPSRIPKRIKWIDEQTLVFNHSGELQRLVLENGSFRFDPHFFGLINRNTVEDFATDLTGRYLVCINYNKLVMLFDLQDGTQLDSMTLGDDYFKGIMRIPEENYGGSFLVYGRTGKVYHIRIHDAQLIPDGIWSPFRSQTP